jgi:hypothetical protein
MFGFVLHRELHITFQSGWVAHFGEKLSLAIAAHAGDGRQFVAVVGLYGVHFEKILSRDSAGYPLPYLV